MAWFKIPIKKFVIKLLNFNIENKNNKKQSHNQIHGDCIAGDKIIYNVEKSQTPPAIKLSSEAEQLLRTWVQDFDNTIAIQHFQTATYINGQEVQKGWRILLQELEQKNMIQYINGSDEFVLTLQAKFYLEGDHE